MMPPAYNRDILRLAASIPRIGVLEDAERSVTMRSPTCGAVLTLQAVFDAGRIDGSAISIEACAYGQAASALLMRHLHGRDEAAMTAALDGVERWLEIGDGMPWPELDLLSPVHGRTGRYGAVLLPFRAAVALFRGGE